MACIVNTRIKMHPYILVLLVTLFSIKVLGQLDLPPLPQVSSTSRSNNNNPFGYSQVSSTGRPLNSPGNQYDIYSTTQRPDYRYSTQGNYQGSSTPGNFPSSQGNYPFSTTPDYRGGSNLRNDRINPDITNRGYPNIDYSNGRGLTQNNQNFDRNNVNIPISTTSRNFNNPNQDERIDINNDPNFNRNDPNFVRNDPNYEGVNGYNRNNFNRDPNNQLDPNNPNNPYNDQFYQRDIQNIRDFLSQADDQASKECTNNVAAQWNFETNVNDVTQLAALDAQQRYTLFQRALWETAAQVPRSRIREPQTYRQLRMLSVIGPAALPPDQLDRYNRLINDMLAVYNNAEICAYNEPFKCGLRLQPDLQLVMSHSRDWDELQHVWTEWRRNTGRRVRDLYEQLVDLTNQAARLNNFTDATHYWTFPYESPNFRQDIEDVWEQIRPLYELLHAYVRRRLRESYGPERISRSAPLPAHILGDMWAQTWSSLLPLTLPYPGKTLVDVSPEMVEQGYTPLTIFQLAEEFFVSMNMSAMPPDFWALSVLQQPPERPVHCQPSAWDFCNKHDFRIKMCAHVDMKDLVTAHHEMAHVQYFLRYANQPKIFRDGANPGFHEAVGEAVALSVSSPRHLQTLGLVQKSIDDTAHDVNFLFTLAMDKLAFLPFALVMDKWRWDVFSGDVRKEQYNCHWWRLREQYAGIKPPVLRSELDFDPGSKYHIPANIPYIRYFVSTILQFQIHRALCRSSGQYVFNDPSHPLHKCDIYRSHDAGRILSRIMEKGSSEPWQQVLLETIGETRLDGDALREYFRPLEEWLRNENLRTGEYVGWTYDGDYCKFSIETAGLQVYGGFYNAARTNFDSISFLTLFLLSATTTFILGHRMR